MASPQPSFEQFSLRSPARRPRLRHIMNLTAWLLGDEPEKAAIEAKQTILCWLADRWPGPIPAAAWEGGNFEAQVPGYYSAAISLPLSDQQLYWAMRFDHPDRDEVGRSWSVEAAVDVDGDSVAFGTRLLCLTLENADALPLSTPRFVIRLADSPGLVRDGYRLSRKPFVIKGDHGVAELVEFLESPDRQLPVIVATTLEDDSTECAVDVDKLAERCFGLAHVVVMPQELSYGLTLRVGSEYTVYWGAVRTYLPGFDSSLDSPYRHKLALRDRIEGWPGGPSVPRGSGAFLEALVRQAYAMSAGKTTGGGTLPAFADVRARHFAELLAHGSASNTSTHTERLYDEERSVLRQQLAEAESVAYELLQRESETEANKIQLEHDLAYLQQQNDILRARLRAADIEPDQEVDIPTHFVNFGYWVSSTLAGRLVVLPKAVREMEKSVYAHPETVYNALLLLATKYRDMRMSGGVDLKSTFENSLASLGMQHGRSISESRAGEQGDEYYVT